MGLLEEGDLARPGSEPTQGINGAMEGVMMESGKGGTFCRSFQVSVLHDDRAMGERAGDALVGLLEEYTLVRGVPVLLNLAAAPSQDQSYAEVVRPEQQGRVDWAKVWVAHLDEYLDLK